MLSVYVANVRGTSWMKMKKKLLFKLTSHCIKSFFFTLVDLFQTLLHIGKFFLRIMVLNLYLFKL